MDARTLEMYTGCCLSSAQACIIARRKRAVCALRLSASNWSHWSFPHGCWLHICHWCGPPPHVSLERCMLGNRMSPTRWHVRLCTSCFLDLPISVFVLSSVFTACLMQTPTVIKLLVLQLSSSLSSSALPIGLLSHFELKQTVGTVLYSEYSLYIILDPDYMLCLSVAPRLTGFIWVSMQIFGCESTNKFAACLYITPGMLNEVG